LRITQEINDKVQSRFQESQFERQRRRELQIQKVKEERDDLIKRRTFTRPKMSSSTLSEQELERTVNQTFDKYYKEANADLP